MASYRAPPMACHNLILTCAATGLDSIRIVTSAAPRTFHRRLIAFLLPRPPAPYRRKAPAKDGLDLPSFAGAFSGSLPSAGLTAPRPRNPPPSTVNAARG